MNKLNTLKKPLIIAFIITILLILFFLIFFSRPANYKERIVIRTTNISANTDNHKVSRIAVFSDLQLGFDYQIEDLPKLIEQLNSLHLDVIVFNGDLLYPENEYSDEQIKQIIDYLSMIKVPAGKFAIAGDQDFALADDILFNAGFETLNNQTRPLNLNNHRIVISGLLNENFDNPLSNLNPDNINLAFIHNPSQARQILAHSIDVLVTSHTFGGQYNLPLFGSVYDDLREYEFYRGIHKIEDKILISNNGIGINRGSMRFLAPSTVDLIIVS
jgi:predicted MPP superfamily phosphohydrolase